MENIRNLVEMVLMDKENSSENVDQLVEMYGVKAFSALAEKDALNLISPDKIIGLVEREELSLLTWLAVLVNKYKAIEEIFSVLMLKAKVYEIGYNLLYITDPKKQNKWLEVYYSKVYPTEVEKVFEKLDDDGLVFDDDVHCAMFIAYCEKKGMPIISKHVLEKMKLSAENTERAYALDAVNRLSK